MPPMYWIRTVVCIQSSQVEAEPLNESISVVDEDALQEEVSNVTLLTFPMSFFVDFSQYQEEEVQQQEENIGQSEKKKKKKKEKKKKKK